MHEQELHELVECHEGEKEFFSCSSPLSFVIKALSLFILFDENLNREFLTLVVFLYENGVS
jgi:hypothetical protein